MWQSLLVRHSSPEKAEKDGRDQQWAFLIQPVCCLIVAAALPLCCSLFVLGTNECANNAHVMCVCGEQEQQLNM